MNCPHCEQLISTTPRYNVRTIHGVKVLMIICPRTDCLKVIGTVNYDK